MSKKDLKRGAYFEDNEGISTVRDQLNASYQSGVIEERVNDNKNMPTFNNEVK